MYRSSTKAVKDEKGLTDEMLTEEKTLQQEGAKQDEQQQKHFLRVNNDVQHI